MMNKQSKSIGKKYNKISSIFDVMEIIIPSSWRKDLVENLEGKILEVGVGTGANLAHYPENAHITGIDLSPKSLDRARAKVGDAKAEIVLREMDAEQLDFPDHTFDVVVAACVFCTVPDPVRGLEEIRRVVKPEGKVVMLEHMRSENKVAGRVLDAMNPVTTHLIGDHVNRKTVENIKKSGMKVEEETFVKTSIMRKLLISPNK